jgi:tetratricopeptide (TPR) repeat protein
MTDGPLLRLTQFATGAANVVEISLEKSGQARQAVRVPFDWRMEAIDREGLRWYFEDYLQYPADPAPSIAAGIEERMAELGRELFRGVFASDDARDLWSEVRNQLATTRVEILTELASTTIPWELLRDPRTDVPVALRAESFTRGYANPAQQPRPPSDRQGPIRILLAICRPQGGEDVPFRSVASRLLKGLSERHRDEVQLVVLRPPTFAQLASALREAAEHDPFHIVHFDGHGTFQSGPTGPGRGYLIFEDDESGSGLEHVDGSRVGQLLAETGVPLLILNACQSARADPMSEPHPSDVDVHARIRAYGSLALEVMDAGIAGVVAMQYNVYVPTAAHFVGDLYATLARGQTLGRAVTLGRKQLHARPRRDLVGAELDFVDWPVPVVYEAAAVPLFSASVAINAFVNVDLDETRSTPAPDSVDAELPGAPDAGFYGRDETLLAIDRLFDVEKTVLLHAYAGSGKTSTAAEFVRWYALTGGINGPILFTTFERYTPLTRVLDDFARVCGAALQDAGISWLSLDDAQRRRVSLEFMSVQPVLWVWDNVEPIAGFPHGTDSAWTAAEQTELLQFLRDLRSTRARVLLTSRRDEQDWLGSLPARISMPGMPFQERVQLARALARRLGSPIRQLDAWRSLLDFTRGNPLTITVVVGEAVNKGLSTRKDLEALADALAQGVAELTGNDREGRSRSLSASLSYGFREAFNETDRERLALLHLFDGEVAAFLFAALGDCGPLSLSSFAGLDDENAQTLLDRAAEIGHLTIIGTGRYAIHPALPAYFKDLFETHYQGDAAVEAAHAFCHVIARAAYNASELYKNDSRVVGFLSAVEANLLRARQIARRHGWQSYELRAMRSLHVLYEHEGRWTEWSRLMDQTVQGLIDPETDGPMPGLEDEWGDAMQWRVRLAFARDDHVEAARLQQLLADRAAARAQTAIDSGQTDDKEAARTFESAAIALSELGGAQVGQRDPQAIQTLERALVFAEWSHVDHVIATVSYNLGVSLIAIEGFSDLDRGGEMLNRALSLLDENNTLQRSRCYGELGFIEMQRAYQAVETGDRASAEEYFRLAVASYEQGLALTPPDAKESLANKHGNLGTLHATIGNSAGAKEHLEAAIRFAEESSQIRVAGIARAQIARLLEEDGQRQAASFYAQRALRDLQAIGGGAALIVDLEAMIARLTDRG